MKLRELKSILNKMSEEQLNQQLIVVANDKQLSGYGEVHKSKCNYYYDGSDDPCPLKSQSELREEYEKDEIEGMDMVLKKGDFYIELH